jgi:hypothetical protein
MQRGGLGDRLARRFSKFGANQADTNNPRRRGFWFLNKFLTEKGNPFTPGNSHLIHGG